MLQEIMTFCRQNGVAPTRLARDAVNDPRLVSDLRHGRVLRKDTEEKIRQYMASYVGTK